MWAFIAAAAMLTAPALAAAQPQAGDAAQRGLSVGAPVPAFAGWTMDETVLTSDKILGTDGRPTVIAFFATWCKPCVEHLPLIDDVALRTASIGTRVVLVAFGQSALDVQPLLRALSLTHLPVILDTHQAIAGRFGVQVLPRVFVVGPDRRIARILTEEDHDFARALEAAIRESVSPASAKPAARPAVAAVPGAADPAPPPDAEAGRTAVLPAAAEIRPAAPAPPRRRRTP